MLSIHYRNDDGQPSDPSGWYRYGLTEWRDLEGAISYAIDHGADRVVLVGLSSGAGVALSFMYQSPLAERVVGLVFDTPNIDLSRTVDYGAEQRSIPGTGIPIPRALTALTKVIVSVRYDVDWDALDYTDDIDLIEVPLLVFHGTADPTVPVDVSERLAAARPDIVTLHLVEGADHVQSWNVDPDAYARVVREFLSGIGASPAG